MSAALRAVAALALLGWAAGAAACGYCIEDRMASVYDHQVMTRAAASGHKIAFFAVEGLPVADPAAAEAIRRDLDRVRGVDRGSVRYSAELAALSLSFDPRATPYAALDRALSRALEPRGLTLGLINIVDRPTQIRAGRTAAR
jgi:hypothetical protein